MIYYKMGMNGIAFFWLAIHPSLSHLHQHTPHYFTFSIAPSRVYFPSRFSSKTFASQSIRSMLWCRKKRPDEGSKEEAGEVMKEQRKKIESNLVFFFHRICTSAHLTRNQIQFRFRCLSMEKNCEFEWMNERVWDCTSYELWHNFLFVAFLFTSLRKKLHCI